LVIFYSRFWNAYSTGIDAFTVDWHGVNGLFVPPIFFFYLFFFFFYFCKPQGPLCSSPGLYRVII
jgi:hypothetical protein